MSIFSIIKEKFFSFHPTKIQSESNDLVEHFDISDDIEFDLSETSDVYVDEPYTIYNQVTGEFKEYYYMGDKYLNQIYGFCMNPEIVKKIQLYVFRFNKKCHYLGDPLPFLEIICENSSEFPQFDFQCPVTNDDDQYFKNECISQLINILPIENKLNDTIIDRLYRGFIEVDDTNLVVVFDISEFPDVELRNSHRYNFRIMDEIKNGIIDKYTFMKDIKDASKQVIDPPILLYMMKYTGNHFEPIYEDTNETNISLLENRSNHPTFGNFYYFSSDVLQKDQNKMLKRYAAFIRNPIDLTENVEADNLSIYSVIKFKENEKTIYCIKPESLFYALK
jgi:hypothetical protein